MEWVREEDSRLIKAWSGTKTPSADNSFCLSPNCDFLVVASVGDIVHPYTGGITTYQNLASIVSQDILDLGWENFTFEKVCEAYIAYLEKFFTHSDFDYSEMEVVFVQNQLGVLDEACTSQEIPAPQPKIPELV